MKSLSTDEIRAVFLNFFEERGHELVLSSPLVPGNDPTLLFTNAGMVQFKDVFTGKEKRSYSRAASSQKCVRAGGKHNDLENVGYTTRHHTFFEMLGNFSFGDYFKKEAIEFAWDLIINVLGLPKERLCVTIFEGDNDIPADEEAANYWKAVGVPAERIFRLGRKDNYWQMGDTGPQGPCTEIHYFLASDLKDMFRPGRLEASDGWVEIWNLVFMQFMRETATGPIERLPKPCVDTGAGLERIASIMQGKLSNYDTDLFRSLIDAIASEVGKPYRGGDTTDEVAMRVIADHSRATTFLVADGVQPSNLGRGYVLRRIMRRAITHGRRLGYDDLFFHRACLRVIDRMKAAYPDLERARSLIEKVAQSEEASFRRTLDNGLKLLSDQISVLEAGTARELAPEFVAKLYHTFGFPIDLTRVIAHERGFSVDEEQAMAIVKASGASEGSLGLGEGTDNVWFEVREHVPATQFTGYDVDQSEARVLAVVDDRGQILSAPHKTDRAARTGESVAVVLDATPFYGESGGQAGDSGTITARGFRMKVRDTKRPRPDLVVHFGVIEEGELKSGQVVTADIDRASREATRKNHSATHLLHLALKSVLGDHVQQKGSLVAPDRLRFDYAHFESVTPEQSAAIERRANDMVLKDEPTVTNVCALDEARSAGAVMLFGEKYDETVRMVRIGGDSLELCGGTHVRRSGEIGLIKIVSDSAIASGIRRLEAVTGIGALEWVQQQAQLLTQASHLLRVGPQEIPEKIDRLLKRSKQLERELEVAKADAAMGSHEGSTDVLSKAEDIGGIRVLIHRADGTPAKSLREVSDRLRDRLGSGVVVLAALDAEKASLLVAVTKDLTGKVDAGRVVKEATLAMDGRGGGQRDFAQGSGKATLLEAALLRVRHVLEQDARGA